MMCIKFKRFFRAITKTSVVVLALSGTSHIQLTAYAAPAGTPPKKIDWSFKKFNGTFDRAAAQRGFLVYQKVCAACHSLNLLRFDKLKGLGLSNAQVAALASTFEVKNSTPNDSGEMFMRKGEPKDSFPAPYPNEQAARAANMGAYPPDLSVITKARFDGANYVYSLLVGYNQEIPEGVSVPEGLHYNPYMPGGTIAMAPPLFADMVSYEDGTPATIDQMAKDVTTFLAWAAEPTMEERKSLGIKVIFYLIFITGLFYVSMRKIWKSVK